MADKLIRAGDLFTAVCNDTSIRGSAFAAIRRHIDAAPAVEAKEVARIVEVKETILQTLDNLIATHRGISNSQFSEYEKHLDIPKSSNDYYGIYADTMEIARRLVNAALTNLCDNCGAKMDGDGNG